MNTLSVDAQQIIAEEEELLAHVLATLPTSARPVSTRDREDLMTHLRELRDEAATATASDLPRLFQQMTTLRALAERDDARPLPDANCPYFAHLRLRDGRGARDYLLGRTTHIDTTSNLRIVDWRFAPIARVFYRYRVGDDFEEEMPGGISEGVVEARRVVVIERGRLTKIVDGSLVLVRTADGAWREDTAGVLGGGAGTATRAGALGLGDDVTRRSLRADITALLDTEQFEALSTPASKPLLVLGSAGSGKTTVALHRLAQLAFDDPQRFPPSGIRVVVPEEGLARLSRRLLAPLGLEKVRVETLDSWLHRTALAVFGVKTIKMCAEPPALVAKLKRHPALHDLLVEAVGKVPKHALDMKVLRRRLADHLSDHAFLARVVERAGGDLPTTAIAETARHTMLQLATTMEKQLEGMDIERITALDARSLDEGTPEELAGSFDPEDLALLLFFRARTVGFELDPIAHLMLDEAEDFSLFELDILGKTLATPRSATLAGDEMQQTQSSFAGWQRSIEALGVGHAAVCRLQVSYRCPRPITELAQQVLGMQAPANAARAGREGVPVGQFSFPDEAQSQLFLAGALKDLVEREPEASIAVIASSPDVAQALVPALDDVPRTRLVVDGGFTFEPGVDITDVTNVKGLEFDYVVIPDATAAAYPATDEARRQLHVAVTRASHQLWVVAAGRRTPIFG